LEDIQSERYYRLGDIEMVLWAWFYKLGVIKDFYSAVIIGLDFIGGLL